MHETEATITTSRRRSSEDVAAWRSRSMSSLRDESFSMYVSDDGQVRLGLVVVVVRDEVLDGVRREELAELVAELRGERLVVRDHERRLLDRRDHVGHRERLARGRRAEQRLVLQAVVDPGRELGDRLRLIAGRLVALAEAEETHACSLGNHPPEPQAEPDAQRVPASSRRARRDRGACRRRGRARRPSGSGASRRRPAGSAAAGPAASARPRSRRSPCRRCRRRARASSRPAGPCSAGAGGAGTTQP